MGEHFDCVGERNYAGNRAEVRPDVVLECELEAEQRPLLLCRREYLELAELGGCVGRHLYHDGAFETALGVLASVGPDE